jgi:nucleotide-binding universal stress UspA family protein
MIDVPLATIFHPSDFSKSDEAAFVHALKLALVNKAELTILHVDRPRSKIGWSEFPRIRPTLVAWGLLPEGARLKAVEKLGIRIKKVERLGGDAAKEILDHISARGPDLIVLATHQRAGLAKRMHRALPEPIARHARTRTLFVPRSVTGFVCPTTGRFSLERILVPVTHNPAPDGAIATAVSLAKACGRQPIRLTTLFVGEEYQAPPITLQLEPNWTTERIVVQGNVEEQILGTAEALRADLIVMATRGHQGFLDALRGSTTERVLHGTKCPLLAVPVS